MTDMRRHEHQTGHRGPTGKWKLSLLISSLALVVALGANGVSYRLQQKQNERFNTVICGLIDSDKSTASRRQKTALAATKLHALAAQFPPGPAKAAITATADVFALSGTGSKAAAAAVNAQLKSLGCKTRV